MGCCVSSGEKRTDREPLADTRPKYSWEKEERPDRSQLIISGKVGVAVVRLPGQLSGRQFHIEDCRECEIFVLDHTSSLTVHGCTNCSLVLGPCGGSVFLRQCEGCTVVVASQQFRVRDCRKCTVYLHCKSQPVIESSHKLRFSCFQAYYHELRDQFSAADLHPFHNQWSHIHNFTNQTGESDWSFAQETTPPIKPPTEGDLGGCGLTFQRGRSTVPYSVGPSGRPSESEVNIRRGCVVVMSGEERESRAREFLTKLQDQVVLVQTCHTHFKRNEAQAFFSDHDSLLAKIRTGPCIIMELTGENCQQICHASLAGVPDEVYHLSSGKEEGERERESLSNYLMSSLTM